MAIREVTDEHDILVITQMGMVIRVPASSISLIGRATKGVRIMNLKEGDKVVAIARLERGEKDEEMEDGAGEDGEGEYPPQELAQILEGEEEGDAADEELEDGEEEGDEEELEDADDEYELVEVDENGTSVPEDENTDEGKEER